MFNRQRAVAMYFIDKLALRAGNVGQNGRCQMQKGDRDCSCDWKWDKEKLFVTES